MSRPTALQPGDRVISPSGRTGEILTAPGNKVLDNHHELTHHDAPDHEVGQDVARGRSPAGPEVCRGYHQRSPGQAPAETEPVIQAN